MYFKNLVLMKAEPEEDDPNDSYEARAMKRKIAKKRAQEVENMPPRL